MAKKTHEEILNIPGYKGNANQKHIDSTSLLLEWLPSRTQTTTNIGKVGGERNSHM
jgi:hypothetical protein